MKQVFFIPEGINPEFGRGNLRIRAWDTQSGLQAMGSIKPIIGGEESAKPQDNIGPEINAKLNGQNSGPFIFFLLPHSKLKQIFLMKMG
ncbi:hypothetical protein [Algoriphagus boritolerans]|uniref:hypothetical protein n=1 Tax=Algoriphagus boritolerans TaxID=308111 RepID=UPI002FCE09BA